MKAYRIMLTFVALFGLHCNDSNPTSSTGATGSTGGTTTSLPSAFNHFVDAVTVSVQGANVVLEAEGIPNHTSPYWGSGHALYEAPHSGMVVNPNNITSQSLTFTIPLQPAVAPTISATSLGPVGIAINGVVLYNQFAAGNAPLTNEIMSFDRRNGHPQNFGQYHYHIEPLFITDNGSELIGFMLDGFPVYGQKDQNGSIPADLDAAHGHTGVTHDYPDGTYHYHITPEAPYISDGYRGSPGTVTQ